MKGGENAKMYVIDGKQVNLEYREYRFSEKFPLFTLLSGEFHFPKPLTELNFMHFHNCVEIGICRRGRQTLYVEEKKLEMGPGDICVIPPYAMHITQAHPDSTEELSCEYLYFLPDRILAGAGIPECPPQLRWYQAMGTGEVFSEKDVDLCRAVDSIMDEMRRKDDCSRQAVYGYLQILYVILTRRYFAAEENAEEDYSERERLFPAILHINKSFEQPISPRDLAVCCDMNLGQFHALFVKQMRMSPVIYLRFVRLQHACELLTGTEKKILDVAMESGFSSLSNFNQCFKEMYHKTPRQWRNETRAIPKIDLNHTLYEPGVDEPGVCETGRKL